MKIYWIRAQAPRRVLAVAKHLELSVDYEQLSLTGGDLQQAQFIELNPNSKVPVLVDGERVLWESAAINAYLSFKAGSDLWPSNKPLEQVEVLRWISWCDHFWSPAVASYYFEHIVKRTFGFGDPDPGFSDSEPSLRRWATVLNEHLAGRTNPALDRLTIADFQLASMARYWRESAMPLQEYPNIVRWLDGLEELPAWADPWPENDVR